MERTSYSYMRFKNPGKTGMLIRLFFYSKLVDKLLFKKNDSQIIHQVNKEFEKAQKKFVSI